LLVAFAIVAVIAGAYSALVLVRSQRTVILPATPGPFAVGRVEDTASDPERDGRQLSIWTWYPGSAGTGTATEYAPGAWSKLALGLPLGQTHFTNIHDSAREGAIPASGEFPVVVLVPGLGFSAPQYTVIAENLASRGYVVVGVTPTGSANVTVLDGQLVGSTAEGNPSDFAGEQSDHDRAVGNRLLGTWVGDARFAAATAGELSQSKALHRHVDHAHTDYVGHSFGGAAALQACHEDARCGAAANIDGGLYGSVATTGLGVPTLLVGHDGSCITGVCSPVTGADRADAAVGQGFVAASAGTVRQVTVPGTGHLNFTDYSVYYNAFPLHKLLGLGDADGRHTLTRTSELIAITLDEGSRPAGNSRPRR
jgi:predicted dienelactone hydrolase